MSTPVPPVPPPATPSATPAPPVVILSAAPPALAALPSQGLVELLVSGGGSPATLAGPGGPLSLTSPLPLPEGSTVTLRLGPQTGTGTPEMGQRGARLIAVDGRPPGAPPGTPPAGPPGTPPGNLAGGPPGTPPGGASAAAGARAGAVSLTTGPGPLLTATVLQAPGLSPPTGTASGPLTQPLPGGTSLGVRIAAISPPTPGGAATAGSAPIPGAGTPSPTPGTPPIPPGAPPATSQPPSQPAPRPATPLQAGAPTGVPTPPPASPAAPQSFSPPLILSGQVAPNTSAGQPLIQTPAGLLAVQVPPGTDLPPGSRVGLEVASLTPPRPAAPTVPPTPILSQPGPGWPALDQALELLARNDPPAARQLAESLPRDGPRLLAASVGFMGALRAADGRPWPGGDAGRALANAGPKGGELARRLTSDLKEMAGRRGEALGSEWRTLTLPFADGAEISRIRMVVRRSPDPEDEDSPPGRRKGGTRFVIDLELSNLGALQLDGLYTPVDKRLDLILRSRHRLPDDMRAELLYRFTESSEAIGLNASLTLQITQHFVTPEALTSQDSHGAGTVV
ncbi:hypothetical protein [Roseospirillum parvum]|uniref:Hook-length control protein FliK n=1 Tax=Roseospirillum parvum TaxID=83401 RepID=A0A1G7W9S5_9PROT|nr:hypothetical protein [Roseospirillum parvum]SDG68737.1 hypothetical protein SAMN05421742_102125 [Roseospirillum parvum]